jgi:hypothetical protein
MKQGIKPITFYPFGRWWHVLLRERGMHFFLSRHENSPLLHVIRYLYLGSKRTLTSCFTLYLGSKRTFTSSFPMGKANEFGEIPKNPKLY